MQKDFVSSCAVMTTDGVDTKKAEGIPSALLLSTPGNRADPMVS